MSKPKNGLKSSLAQNDNIVVIKPYGVTNEFIDTEIEQKFQILGDERSDFLDEIINALLSTGNFAVVEELERFGWVFHFDYYGYFENGKPHQVFHTIHHESTPKYWIRKKLSRRQSSQNDSTVPLVRKEELEAVDSAYLDKYIAPVVKEYRDSLGKEIILLGRVTRQKRYVFLQNKESRRIYNVSLDFCDFMNRHMSQLEVEYKWRDKKAVEGYGDLAHLLVEVDHLNDTLLSSKIGSLIAKTTLTKFDWMVEVLTGADSR